MRQIRRRDFVRNVVALATVGGASALPSRSSAQQGQPLRILCGFPAGDGMDVVARLYAERMRGPEYPTVIVDNKPGAGGRIAVEAIRQAPRDGTVALFTPSAMMNTYPHVFKKLNYDPLADVVPVSKVAGICYSLSVGPMVPESVRTLPQFLEWCRTNPGKASYGISAPGSPFHLIGESLAKSTRTPLTMVAYKGGSLAALDVIGGQIAAFMSTPSVAIEHVRKGSVRMLAISSPTRWPQLPDVPTFAEQGYPQLTALDWFGAFLPAGTPGASVDQLNAVIRRAAASPELQQGLQALTLTPDTTTVDAFQKIYREEYVRWGEIVKSIGFQPLD